MYSQDYYYSSLDGELASTSATTYGARFENGNFLSYTYSTSTNTWIATDKVGTKYTFGTSTGSRLDNPSNSAQIYKWQLTEIRDTNNNYITYSYFKDSGQILPSQVIYTGNGTTDGPFEIDFLRQARSDIASSSVPGLKSSRSIKSTRSTRR
jgi:virulence plasmid B protein